MADLIQNLISDPLTGADALNGTKDRIDAVSQCRVIWYQWDFSKKKIKRSLLKGLSIPTSKIKEVVGPLWSLATGYDITEHVTGVTFTKSLGNASGTFNIQLSNSLKWDDFVTPGSWVVVYMSNDGTLNAETDLTKFPNPTTFVKEPLKQLLSSPILAAAKPLLDYLGLGFDVAPAPPLPLGPSVAFHTLNAPKRRFMGVVQRINSRSITKQNQEVEITYTLSGKDHGIIFDETTIWFDRFNYKESVFKAFVSAQDYGLDQSLHNMMAVVYNLIYNPRSKVLPETVAVSAGSQQSQDFTSMGEFTQQWALPSGLAFDLGFFKLFLETLTDVRYVGEAIDADFQTSPFATSTTNPAVDVAKGGVGWNVLKGLSEPGFHELFTEMGDNGRPGLVFRLMPWARNKSSYPVIGAFSLSLREMITNNFDLISIVEILLNPNIALSPPSELSYGEALLQAGKNKALKELKRLALQAIGIGPFRVDHSLKIMPVEIESFDLGPSLHEKFNTFMVGTSYYPAQGTGKVKPLSLNGVLNYPLRDLFDVYRSGQRNMFIDIKSYMTKSLLKFFLKTEAPEDAFLREATNALEDYYNEGRGLYSGTFNLALGRNQTRIGKALITDSTQPGIRDMGFYIEGYTDNFVVDVNGTSTWKQTIQVTRGDSLEEVLKSTSEVGQLIGAITNTIGNLASQGQKPATGTAATFHRHNKLGGKN